MSEQTTDAGKATAEIVGVFSDKLDTYLAAAQKVFEQYGGDAANLGLNVLRIDAISQMTFGIIAGIILLSFWRSVKRWNNNWMDITRKARYTYFHSLEDGTEEKARLESVREFWDLDVRAFCGHFLFFVYMLLGLFAVIDLADLWAWTGVFYPELYAVHKFLL